MTYTSIFDLFKIGLGPSSSHTVGPMRAAAMFATELANNNFLSRTSHVSVDLYGSLALTGRGHATDRALLLGLEGHRPDSVDPEAAVQHVQRIRDERELRLNGTHPIEFVELRDVAWHFAEMLPRHPNGMRITAFANDGSILNAQVYYSVGGGFVETDGTTAAAEFEGVAYPYPFTSASELLAISSVEQRSIPDIVLANENALRPQAETLAYIDRVIDVMDRCVERGFRSEGVLPGGLNVRRRAPRLHARLAEKQAAGGLEAMDTVNAVAMAVNEENAAGGRVVTAPTNGAAGVIPAVVHYYRTYAPASSHDGLVRFMLTATAIGSLYKNNASISGAEVGCQGEVGVACSMAAGGLVAAMNGTSEQIEHAAEIGMEHSLGMTCDPIGGLVQIPCIERNAVGAVRAIHAARMAMEDSGDHHVSLDQVIEVMYRTGLDMQSAYKETSLGGLAVSIVEC